MDIAKQTSSEHLQIKLNAATYTVHDTLPLIAIAPMAGGVYIYDYERRVIESQALNTKNKATALCFDCNDLHVGTSSGDHIMVGLKDGAEEVIESIGQKIYPISYIGMDKDAMYVVNTDLSITENKDGKARSFKCKYEEDLSETSKEQCEIKLIKRVNDVIIVVADIGGHSGYISVLNGQNYYTLGTWMGNGIKGCGMSDGILLADQDNAVGKWDFNNVNSKNVNSVLQNPEMHLVPGKIKRVVYSEGDKGLIVVHDVRVTLAKALNKTTVITQELKEKQAYGKVAAYDELIVSSDGGTVIAVNAKDNTLDYLILKHNRVQANQIKDVELF